MQRRSKKKLPVIINHCGHCRKIIYRTPEGALEAQDGRNGGYYRCPYRLGYHITKRKGLKKEIEP